MPIFQLNHQYIFPRPEFASPDGILALGGDLAPERLLLAYNNGIFPWYSDGDPIIWWSPDPRFVLFPQELHIPRSMKKVLRKNTFTFTMDRAFREVISHCRSQRLKTGTWITLPMQEAYTHLHHLGFAHSIEAWENGKLSGGLYGVSLGKIFFAESMFTLVDNAGKAALLTLVLTLRDWGFELIDSQVHTDNVARFGARDIPRKKYLQLLKKYTDEGGMTGSWSTSFESRDSGIIPRI